MRESGRLPRSLGEARQPNSGLGLLSAHCGHSAQTWLSWNARTQESGSIIQSILLVLVTAVATWFIMHRARSGPGRATALTHEEKEIGRAKDIGTQLDGARDRASVAEVERNKLALAKAVKAALWVTEARLNLAVPELLKMAQLWSGKSNVRGKK